MEFIKIGKITSAHGIKGEIKIYSYMEEPEIFLDIDEIFIAQEEKYKASRIESARIKGITPLLKLEGIDDRNAAEAVRGSYIYMDSEDLPELAEGEFYVRDLIGFDVVTDKGERLGTLKDIYTSTPQKLYIVKRENKKELLIPGVDEFILKKDIEGQMIVVKLPEGLLEI